MREKKNSVEKRQEIAKAWIQKTRSLFPGRFPRGSGAPNRHGAPKLPTGQKEVAKWPVLDLGGRPELSRETWRLEIDGLCERPQVLDFNRLMGLEQIEERSDFHCVTTWSKMDLAFKGVRFRTIADLVGVKAEARFVFITGYDRQPGTGVPYTTNISLDAALEEDVLLVHEWNGEPLPDEHGGPVRMITPKLYAWKGTKWIQKISFLSENKLGFWEQKGFSETAHPWMNDRYNRSMFGA
ncbi:MAG: molybdopterin-dependent oxidoreductase [Planctomycetota bacterium]|nr:molybdopterin-dependent oxidoreductase [Planctomycetota bacterium]